MSAFDHLPGDPTVAADVLELAKRASVLGPEQRAELLACADRLRNGGAS